MRRLFLQKGGFMKKVQTHKRLYGASVLMVLGFCIHLIVDYIQYSSTMNSAPFWVWIMVDSLYWLLPAAVCWIAGYLAKKRMTKKEKAQ